MNISHDTRGLPSSNTLLIEAVKRKDSAQTAITTWILPDNLHLFLERVSALIGYRFEDWDWDAVRLGVRDTDLQRDQWYEYELSGSPSVKLTFAHAGDAKHLTVKVESEEHTAIRIDAIARIMQCYDEVRGTQDLEILIQAAFIETPKPDEDEIVSCTAAHLAICPEHQEALAFFRGKHWMDLVRGDDPLPRSPFLSQKARRFFFPAYLVAAIRDHDGDLLETALSSMGKETWTPFQQELIEAATYLPEARAS
jgi:hypothetical protein